MTNSHDTSTPAMSSETVPSEEFVLVPREPTLDMLSDGEIAYHLTGVSAELVPTASAHVDYIYRAMVGAAPNPSPAAKGGEAEAAGDYVRLPRDRAHRHAVELEQCSIFAADVGDAIAKSMTDAAADLRAALATPSPQPADAVRKALQKIAALRYSEAGEPFDEALAIADAALSNPDAVRGDAPYCDGAVAHIDIGGLLERHVEELRVHAAKLRWQMENDERPIPPHGWTCYHCSQTFTTTASAAAHFGGDPLGGRPECCDWARDAVYAAVAEWAEGPCDNTEDLVSGVFAALSTPTEGPASQTVPEPVYKAVERILDEHSAWVARPNAEVTRKIAFAVTVAAHTIIDQANAEETEFLASQTEGMGGDAAQEAEAYIQSAVDHAPEPLRRLGVWLANKLDEDDWITAERMLLGAALTPPETAEAVPVAGGDMNACPICKGHSKFDECSCHYAASKTVHLVPETARLREELERVTRENATLREERHLADNALVDRYRDPKTGSFQFPTDVATIVRRLDATERERDDVVKALETAREDLAHSEILRKAAVSACERLRMAASPEGPIWGRWFKYEEAPAGSYSCLCKKGDGAMSIAWMPAQGRPRLSDTFIMPFDLPARSASSQGGE